MVGTELLLDLECALKQQVGLQRLVQVVEVFNILGVVEILNPEELLAQGDAFLRE